MRALARIRRASWGIRQELSWGRHHVKSGRLSYWINVLAYRALAVTPRIPGANGVHRLETTEGVVLFYRRNRGDVQGIREIFIDEIYRLPEGAEPTSLVDLGANIGLATVWLCHEYGVTEFVALEPMIENFEILDQNCRANGLTGSLRNVAVGPTTGSATFDVGGESNLGRVGTGTLTVEVVGIQELLDSLGFAASLLKIDIEGMEQQLFATSHGDWVSTFAMITIEMHPQYFEIDPLINEIRELGFTYFPPVEISNGIRRSKRERLFVRSPTSLTR
jgi:FkbM family methyltransferase